MTVTVTGDPSRRRAGIPSPCRPSIASSPTRRTASASCPGTSSWNTCSRPATSRIGSPAEHRLGGGVGVHDLHALIHDHHRRGTRIERRAERRGSIHGLVEYPADDHGAAKMGSDRPQPREVPLRHRAGRFVLGKGDVADKPAISRQGDGDQIDDSLRYRELPVRSCTWSTSRDRFCPMPVSAPRVARPPSAPPRPTFR